MVLSRGSIKTYFFITRPLNLALVLLTLLLFRYFYVIPELKLASVNLLPSGKYILACLSIIFSMASGYIVNDIFDYKADIVNKPEKTFIEKSISKQSAFKYYIFLSILSLSLAAIVTLKLLIIILATNSLLLFYSLLLKRVAFIGNLLISFLSAIIPLLAIWIDTQYIFQTTNDSTIFYLYRFGFVFSLLTFFGTLAREIIKDIQDLNGDKLIKAKTLPVIIGSKNSKYISIFFLFILCGMILIYPPIIANDIFFFYFLILVVIPLLISVFKLRRAKKNLEYNKSASYIKLAMFFTILFIALNGLLSYDIF